MTAEQTRFYEICKSHLKRKGSEELLRWLSTTDFFKAPASTRFHLAREGGLLTHSLNVYDRLLAALKAEAAAGRPVCSPEAMEETAAICGLFHDLCKVDFYQVSYRNAKNDRGEWEKVPYYTVNDTLPYGHGEKSVYILSGFLRLTREEAFAIRWHMGGFDDAVQGGSYAVGEAFARFPLAVLLHTADLQATYLDEKEEG